MKRLRSIMSLLLTIVLVFMTGCSGNTTGNMNVDDSLRTLAQTEAEEYEHWSELKGGLELVKLNNRYELVDVISGQCVYYIDDVNKFYEDADPYEDFVFEELEYKFSSKELKKIERAKELACGYIDESLEFAEEEKEVLKSTINDVKFCYGYTPGEIFGVNSGHIMRTHNTTVYLSQGAEKYFTVAAFLHEFIHVISNVTNRESKYEISGYRFTAMNEGVTELITRQILINAGLKKEIMDIVSYESYFMYVYALMDKVDLIHGYFHSEDFDNVFDGIDREWIDVYYMLVDWSGADYPFWAYSQF